MSVQIDPARAAAFSGHRSEATPWTGDESQRSCKRFMVDLFVNIDELYNSGIRQFLFSATPGCDFIFGEIILAMREHPMYRDIRLVLVQGYRNEAPTEASARERYRNLWKRADAVVILQGAHTPDCDKLRAVYMVDHSTRFLTTWGGEIGDEDWQVVQYARQKGRRVNCVRLETESRRELSDGFRLL